MTAETLAAFLSGRGIDVSTRSGERWAPCPAHEDPTPSVSWKDGQGRILLRCKAGCDTGAVMAGWGLGLPDLFHDAEDPGHTHARAPARLPTEDELRDAADRLAHDTPTLRRLGQWRHWTDAEVLKRLGVGERSRGRVSFPIRDGDGRLIGVCDYDPNPNRREGSPKTVSTGKRDLFPAPEFVKGDELLLVEGEGDAVTALMLGLNAVGVPGAAWWAGRRGRDAAARMRNRHRILILPDADDAGAQWAQRAAEDCAGLGLDVRILDWGDVRDGYDLTDLVGESTGLDTARAFVTMLAKRSTPYAAGSLTQPRDAGTMGEEAFIGLAGRVANAIDPITEADKAAVLVQFLAAFGNVVGHGPHMVLDGSRHSCALYLLVVGQSSKSRKGTSWNRVAEIVSRGAPMWHNERIASGLSSGEGLVWEVRDPVIERVSKKTGETEDDDDADDDDGYVKRIIDPGVEDKRLLVLETEFAGALRVMRRDTNVLSAFLRNLWDRGTAGGMTKNSRTRTHNAHVSIVGHITVEELRREMAQLDLYNGFANRFLYVVAKRSKRLPSGGSLDDFKLSEYGLEFAQAVDWAQHAHRVIFDADAVQLWERAYVGELAEARAGPFGAVTARSEPMVARLAMIYALLDGASLIRPHHFRAALAVWRYCDNSARYLFAGLGTSHPDADRLHKLLREHPKGLTRLEIRDALQRNWNSERIGAALQILRDAGMATVEAVETGGRPAERWRAV